MNASLRMKHYITLFFLVVGLNFALAELQLNYYASITTQASHKSLAPYMLGSWNYGRYAEGSGIWQEAGIIKMLDMSKRFSWSAGVEYLAGVGSKTYYQRWNQNTSEWGTHNAKMPYFSLSQIFGQLKYRSVYLTIGMKNSRSKIVDEALSSGDLTRSNNALPIPGVAAGFLDFQNIPFTNGWVQIDGEIMYGKMMDSNFKKDEFNFYSGLEPINLLYNYKRCYFRTNPDKNFHIVVGMQAAALFGGTTYHYTLGKLTKTVNRGFRIKDVFQMFFPLEGGEDYYTGGHLGSWDFKAVYKFQDKSNLTAYFEWPWEDGSGIGRKNGWDGLWGIRYDFGRKGLLSKALFEFLDFTNQSGPIHYDPDDNPENPLSGRAEGADNYYNNDYYGAYTNYGMSIGTPFLLAPIYNRNGMLSYLHNRARGFHAALEGDPLNWLSYRLMIGYETAGGAGNAPAFRKLSSTSGMIEVVSSPLKKIPQLEFGVRLAADKGSLRGNNLGARLQVAFNGYLNIKKSNK